MIDATDALAVKISGKQKRLNSGLHEPGMAFVVTQDKRSCREPVDMTTGRTCQKRRRDPKPNGNVKRKSHNDTELSLLAGDHATSDTNIILQTYDIDPASCINTKTIPPLRNVSKPTEHQTTIGTTLTNAGTFDVTQWLAPKSVPRSLPPTFTASTAPLAYLSGVKLSLNNPTEFRKHAVAKLTQPTLFRKHIPNAGGANDAQLGALSRHMGCKTCGGTQNCQGHWGMIPLEYPCFNPLFDTHILKVARAVCYRCSRLLLNKDDPRMRLVERAKPEHRLLLLAKFGKTISYCGYCPVGDYRPNWLIAEQKAGHTVGINGLPSDDPETTLRLIQERGCGFKQPIYPPTSSTKDRLRFHCLCDGTTETQDDYSTTTTNLPLLDENNATIILDDTATDKDRQEVEGAVAEDETGDMTVPTPLRKRLKKAQTTDVQNDHEEDDQENIASSDAIMAVTPVRASRRRSSGISFTPVDDSGAITEDDDGEEEEEDEEDDSALVADDDEEADEEDEEDEEDDEEAAAPGEPEDEELEELEEENDEELDEGDAGDDQQGQVDDSTAMHGDVTHEDAEEQDDEDEDDDAENASRRKRRRKAARKSTLSATSGSIEEGNASGKGGTGSSRKRRRCTLEDEDEAEEDEEVTRLVWQALTAEDTAGQSGSKKGGGGTAGGKRGRQANSMPTKVEANMTIDMPNFSNKVMYEILKAVSEEDRERMGLKSRPEDMFLVFMAGPPNCLKPGSSFDASGKTRGECDLTRQIREIIRVNHQISKAKAVVRAQLSLRERESLSALPESGQSTLDTDTGATSTGSISASHGTNSNGNHGNTLHPSDVVVPSDGAEAIHTSVKQQLEDDKDIERAAAILELDESDDPCNDDIDFGAINNTLITPLLSRLQFEISALIKNVTIHTTHTTHISFRLFLCFCLCLRSRNEFRTTTHLRCYCCCWNHHKRKSLRHQTRLILRLTKLCSNGDVWFLATKPPSSYVVPRVLACQSS